MGRLSRRTKSTNLLGLQQPRHGGQIFYYHACGFLHHPCTAFEENHFVFRKAAFNQRHRYPRGASSATNISRRSLIPVERRRSWHTMNQKYELCTIYWEIMHSTATSHQAFATKQGKGIFGDLMGCIFDFIFYKCHWTSLKSFGVELNTPQRKPSGSSIVRGSFGEMR